MGKILLCDDSAFARKRLKDIIKNYGHEIIEASNGREALEKALNENPDLVMLDLLMPEMDGTDVLKELKEKNYKTPVVIVSADIQESTINLCLDLGAKSFINKPPKAGEIEAAIESAFNNKGE